MELLSKRRGRVELIGEILNSICKAGKPIRAAGMTSRIKLSWSHLGPLVKGMMECGLLTKDGFFYDMTIEGRQLLSWFKPLMKKIKFLDKKLRGNNI